MFNFQMHLTTSTMGAACALALILCVSLVTYTEASPCRGLGEMKGHKEWSFACTEESDVCNLCKIDPNDVTWEDIKLLYPNLFKNATELGFDGKC